MEIFIVDDQPPEVTAMLQALYSRSPTSVVNHLKEVKERGAEKFMSTYYVGYGHKSIGDCGTTSLFIENVSMLAAKAIQDHPLYNGQEASTRYLDMTKQEVLNPLGTEEGASIQQQWMSLYKKTLDSLIVSLKNRFPRQDEKPLVWEKAIKAKAFDVARGLLPAGCTTYVAWHTNLRQANDHLKELRNHPLEEIRNIAAELQRQLAAKYPSSFCHKIYPEEEAYIKQSMDRFAFYDSSVPDFEYEHNFDLFSLRLYKDLFSTRPPKAELHQRFRQFGTITFWFNLDFGSYRDLQRQRSCVQEMPLLTTSYGFNLWYLDQAEVTPEIYKIVEKVDKLDCDEVTRQYYIPMGFNCPVRLTCTLPSAIYIAELRSGQTVHPTLRKIAQKMGAALKETIPELALYCDNSPDAWSIKRGQQDIVRVDK